MRLLCDNLLLASSCNGSPGVEEVRWMRPVFPDDRLSATAEVQAARPLRSRPTLGMVTLLATVRNQDGLPVMTSRNAILFARKEAAA